MQPRITLNENSEGELEIWINQAGRDLLVQELNMLTENNDHFHLGPPDSGMDVSVRNRPYRTGDRIIEWAKVMLRPDEWDRTYFPHVMDDA